uniref:PHD-type domain-containing protein n=1 Tax=Romanomermis culicivorax TaxID=13658 RepID=A0A915IVR2_ROMCU
MLENMEHTFIIMKKALKIVKKSTKIQSGESEDNEGKCGGTFCSGEGLSKDHTLLWLYCNECRKWYHTACLLLFTDQEISEASNSLHYKCSNCKQEIGTIQTIISTLERKVSQIQRNVIDQREMYEALQIQLKEQENLIKFGHGPAVLALELSLDDLQIDRLAYHSGTFVGNHVHKMVTGAGPKKLTEALAVVGANRQAIYEALFSVLGKIHSIITAKRFLSRDEVSTLKLNCESFGTMFLKQFPSATIIPKIQNGTVHTIEP